MTEDKEPTVLDFVKAILMPWKGPIPKIPTLPSDMQQESQPNEDGFLQYEDEENEGQDFNAILSSVGWMVYKKTPWKTILSLLLAVFAQFLLEPPFRNNDSILAKIVPETPFLQGQYHYVVLPILLYIVSAILLIISIVRHEWKGVDLEAEEKLPFSMKGSWLLLGSCTPILLLLSFLAFHFSGSGNTQSNEFNFVNLVIWFAAILIIIWLLWLPEKNTIVPRIKTFFADLFQNRHIRINLSLWTLLLLAVFGLVIYFRTDQFTLVPKEMFSDQAEKLWDVGDILNGKYSIFFPRNTGREGFQMYLTALIINLFNTGLTFNSLKIGTVLAGILTLPYMYLLGKELGNKWVGLLAVLLAGIAFWPNLISRIGLRFPLYPLFVAPVLFYLIRGIRRSRRNDFILSGIALGIGLHGYSPIRILPFVIVFAVAIYLIHHTASGKRWQVIAGLGIIALVSFVIFLPLFNYMMVNLDMFGFRAFSRLAETERSYPAPVWQIFLGNIKNAILMFFWSDGSIWVNSVPYRPALDFVSAALFFMGIIYLIIRYVQKHNWVDLFLLLSVPMLMMPSILSLAFPDENPALNRTAGAMVPVFLIAAIGFEGLLATLVRGSASIKTGKTLAVITTLMLVIISCNQNAQILFNDFKNQYNKGAWNTTEIGQVIHGYTESVGSPETAYVIPYPHWVDTRLVGINAGFPSKDYALAQANINATRDDPRTKLFIYNINDQKTGQALQNLYPNGILSQYTSEIEGKNFYIFLAPGTSE